MVGACLVLGTAPEPSHAKDRQTAKAKSKKKSKKQKNANRSKGKTNGASEAGESQGSNGEPRGNWEDSLGDDDEPKGILTEGATGDGALRRSNRMEFDERLVKGQVAKSGAVYLFKRVPRRLPGLVPMRKSYRRRIVEPVLGVWELKPATYSKKKDSSAGKGDKKGSYISTVPESDVDTGAASPNGTLSSADKKEIGKPGGDK
jgi:hypothetical protein